MADDFEPIAVMKMADAERIRTELARQEVEIVFYHNQQTCSTGCATTVEVHAKRTDFGKIGAFFNEEQNRRLEGFEFDPELLNQVFDPANENATCPACGTVFSTSKSECPDCGLVFAT